MTSGDYQRQLGERLRSIRNQQGLTLQEVEERSDGEWKAVVIGSYERGDRAISVAKLARLAAFYGVPIAELLPDPLPAGMGAGGQSDEPKLVLDLARLTAAGKDDETLETLSRYASRIQVERGDYNGRVLTLRADDLHTLAAVFGVDTDELLTMLSEERVLQD